MKRRYFYIPIIITLLALVSCQEDEFGPYNVKVRLYGKEHVNVTRSGSYEPLGPSYSTFVAGLYVTMGQQQSCFPMSWNGSSLGCNILLEKGDYIFYSYIPERQGTTLVNATDTEPAKLMFTGVPGLGNEDIMISHAAVHKSVTNQSTVTVPMNLDHVMACVSPQFYLDETYAAMRTIKIKAVEFAIFDGENISIPYYTATASYSGTDSHNITWGDDSAAPLTQWVKVYDANTTSDTLQTTKNLALALGNCYVSPRQSTAGLKMRVTYNVYDKSDQLLRENVQAVNAIKKLEDLAHDKTLTAGNNYKLYIKVVPSYLYVLSDNDESSVFVINDLP